MEPDIEELRKNYERLDDARIIRLASEEATELRPEALELLKQIIKERGLSPVVGKAIEVQFKEIDERTLLGYCELLRLLPCPACKSVNEKLNGNIIATVSGGYYFENVKIACPTCLDRAYSRSNLSIALSGWWRLPGLYNTPRALIFNKKMKKFDHIEEPSGSLRLFVAKQAGRIELNCNSTEGLIDILLYPR
jgi:hypothetical protein